MLISMQLYCLKVLILNNTGKVEIYIPQTPYLSQLCVV